MLRINWSTWQREYLHVVYVCISYVSRCPLESRVPSRLIGMERLLFLLIHSCSPTALQMSQSAWARLKWGRGRTNEDWYRWGRGLAECRGTPTPLPLTLVIVDKCGRISDWLCLSDSCNSWVSPGSDDFFCPHTLFPVRLSLNWSLIGYIPVIVCCYAFAAVNC